MSDDKTVRRVVTGHDAEGNSMVLSDGPAHAIKTHPLRPNHQSTDVWKTLTSPVILRAEESDPTLLPRTMHPPPNGTIIRISHVAPDSEALMSLTPEKSREIYKASGNEGASTFGQGGRHPLIHRTESIDYAVVLDGEITMVLDKEDVHLKTGDVVIQRGTNHAWSNRSGKIVKMLYILIGGDFAPELEASLAKRADAH